MNRRINIYVYLEPGGLGLGLRESGLRGIVEVEVSAGYCIVIV